MTDTVPTDWETKALGDWGEIVGGGTPSSDREEFWGGSHPWATPTEVVKLRGRYIEKTERNLTEEGLQKSSAKLHPKGTLLLTSRASIGYPAICSVPMSTNQGFQSLRLNESVDVEFAYQYFVYRQTDLLKYSQGSTF